MNGDFTTERFNVPKLEALDHLRAKGLTIGVHWWATSRATRVPARPRTVPGKAAGKTLAPTLVDFDVAVRQSGLVSASTAKKIPGGTGLAAALPRASALNRVLANEFRDLDVIFVDPDTGVSPRFSPAYITPDEIALIVARHHALVYHHYRQVSRGTAADRLRQALERFDDVSLWSRSGAECLLVWVPRQRSRTARRFRPPGLHWVEV